MAHETMVARLTARVRLGFDWMRRRKLATFGLLVALILLAEYVTFPSLSEVASLKSANPRTTALMEQRADEASSRRDAPPVRQQWVRLSRVSDDLQHAIIVAEDGMFYEHGGVDWYEVKESLKKDLQKRRFARGASTITQQLAKNLYLSTSKDPVRKLKEFILSGWLEDELTKNRILEIYVNVIEWGDGVYGAEAAALKYFGKHASDLTRDESARLAAVIPSPRRYSPASPSPYVARRARTILARMSARGW